jgi:hypothetical protein
VPAVWREQATGASPSADALAGSKEPVIRRPATLADLSIVSSWLQAANAPEPAHWGPIPQVRDGEHQSAHDRKSLSHPVAGPCLSRPFRRLGCFSPTPRAGRFATLPAAKAARMGWIARQIHTPRVNVAVSRSGRSEASGLPAPHSRHDTRSSNYKGQAGVGASTGFRAGQIAHRRLRAIWRQQAQQLINLRLRGGIARAP